MLRVRIDGGRLTTEQLRVVAGIATEFGRDVADITDRQNVQLHWIRDRGRARDLAPARGGRPVDHRGLRRHPAQHARLPARRRSTPTRSSTRTPVIDATVERVRQGDTGVLQPAPQVQDRDLRLRRPLHRARDQRRRLRRRAPARTATPGFDLWVGGGLSTNPMFAERLGVFVRPERGPGGLGRRHLDLPRLRLPPLAHPRPDQVPDGRLGPGEVPRGAREGVPRPRAARRPAAAAAGAERRDHVGVTAQKDGKFAVGVAPAAGRVSGTLLAAVADLADRYGEGRSRTTVEQKLVILGVSDRTTSSRWSPSSRRSTCSCRPSRLPSRHDGLHRPRVLQARHRRDQGTRPAT